MSQILILGIIFRFEKQCFQYIHTYIHIIIFIYIYIYTYIYNIYVYIYLYVKFQVCVVSLEY